MGSVGDAQHCDGALNAHAQLRLIGWGAKPDAGSPSASALILVSQVQKSTVQQVRPSGPSGASGASSAANRCSSTRFWCGARPAGSRWNVERTVKDGVCTCTTRKLRRVPPQPSQDGPWRNPAGCQAITCAICVLLYNSLLRPWGSSLLHGAFR